jgi:prepilin-type N-terminal cleavage/methylation domain-containing protein
MKKGFTLVELSIVLVIIGMLTGGILVAQSLIENAKIKSIVRTFEQYGIAVNTFKAKYKTLPGDSPSLLPAGNGDGVLSQGANGTAPCAAAPNATLSNQEGYQLFTHLSQAQMVSKRFSAFSPANGGIYMGCGGTHGNDYHERKNADVIGPYTELDAKAAATMLTEEAADFSRAVPETGTSNGKPFFLLFLNNEYIIPLEQKLGSVPYPNTTGQVGVTNSTGQGQCVYNNYSTTGSCTDTQATVGALEYYFPFR